MMAERLGGGKTYPICGMRFGARSCGAASASKGIGGFFKKETRRPHVQRVFAAGRHFIIDAPTDRNDAAERFHRHASAHSEQAEVQDVGYFSKLGFLGCSQVPRLAPPNRLRRGRSRSQSCYYNGVRKN